MFFVYKTLQTISQIFSWYFMPRWKDPGKDQISCLECVAVRGAENASRSLQGPSAAFPFCSYVLQCKIEALMQVNSIYLCCLWAGRKL